MKDADIIIIGAGVCGLFMANELANSGRKILILEARNRTGGRIHTIVDEPFPDYNVTIEAGAEFIHGSLPLTLSILRDAGIPVQAMQGDFIQLNSGNPNSQNSYIEDYRALENKLRELKSDIPVWEFLELNFPGERFIELKNSVKRFVNGYDAADASKMSTFTFRSEWLREDESEQFRPVGGYGGMIQHLEKECEKKQVNIQMNSEVNKIVWKENDVSVICNINDKVYKASKVIITLPLGVLSSAQGAPGNIYFEPEIPQLKKILNAQGYGGVIKVVFHFKNAFWKDAHVGQKLGRNLQHLGFIISDQVIPTWWTQYPDEVPMLTGWLGGPPAESLVNESEATIIDLALSSLSSIFQMEIEMLKNLLIGQHVFNWCSDPFAHGAYSYMTPHSEDAIRILTTPINDTLYFAGEGIHVGSNSGTVEAALASGLLVSKKIIDDTHQ